MKKNLKISNLVILLIILVFTLSGCSLDNTSQNNALLKQKDCTKTGLASVQLYKSDNKVETLGSPNFHYNKKSGKCYAYFEVAPYMLCESARIVFDVDINKEILISSFCDGDLRYVDDTKYPARIIDRTEYIQIRNSLLEL